MAFQSTFMQAKTTKTLPTHTTSFDGKGRHTLVQTSHWLGVLAFTAVLLLLAGCLYADNRMQRSQFFSDLMMEHRVEEQQRIGKLQAETRLTEVSAVIGNQASIERAHQSDLRIMEQHISFVQKDTYGKITKLVDDSSLSLDDETIKKLLQMINDTNSNVLSIVHNKLTNVQADTSHYEREVKHIQDEIVQELTEQQKQQKALQEPKTVAELAKLETEEKIVDDRVTEGLNSLFEHVNALADRMGDTDVDALLDSTNLNKWERILADTETGKTSYPEGVKQMEAVLEKFPAVLKLAEAQGVIQLVEGDGGAKGVDEVTNFRALLGEVRRLPQYSRVLEVYDSWKQGKRTTEQVLIWLEKKMKEEKLDSEWIVAATSAKTQPAADAGAATEIKATTGAGMESPKPTKKQHKLMDHRHNDYATSALL